MPTIFGITQCKTRCSVETLCVSRPCTEWRTYQPPLWRMENMIPPPQGASQPATALRGVAQEIHQWRTQRRPPLTQRMFFSWIRASKITYLSSKPTWQIQPHKTEDQNKFSSARSRRISTLRVPKQNNNGLKTGPGDKDSGRTQECLAQLPFRRASRESILAFHCGF